VALQDTLVANAQAQLDLIRAREQVGAATSLDVRRSEVTLGNARVNQIRERNNAEIEMLRLFQIMGVQKVEGTRLTSAFPVTEPKLNLNELLTMARVSNPVYNAAKARESAANSVSRQARAQYLPSVSFNTGWSGNSLEQTNIEPQIASARAQTDAARASCLTQDSIRVGAGLPARGTCSNIQFTDADADAMRAANNQYPFTFSKAPFGYSFTVSLPVFNGFRREEQIQSAEASRNDARYAVRAQELQMVTDITSAYNTLTYGYEAVKLQEQTAATSQQALALAQERFRVGASDFTTVSQARADFETASNTLIRAQYDFHKFYVALETAVGRPLR
jgi:outer membrane protein